METLYTLFILPIELLMNWILQSTYAYTNSFGISIILLSIIINILIIPLNYLADKWALREKTIQKSMKDMLEQINVSFKGQERYMMLRTLYRQYEYHPIYALRTSFGLLLQIPFFIAAYQLLSTYPAFNNVSFLFLKNLSAPDALFSMGNFQINILPIIMTGISLITAYVYNKNATKNEKIQSYGLALLFLVLLYTSPAGLVLYWTLNNIAYLARNILKSHKKTESIPLYNSRTIKEAYPSNAMWKKLAKPLGSIALTVPLGWLLSHIFMWSNNAHTFSNKALSISFILIILIAIIFWGLGCVVLWMNGKVFSKIERQLHTYNENIIHLCMAVLFASVCSLGISVIIEPILNPFPVKPILIGIFLVFCSVILFARNNWKKLSSNFLRKNGTLSSSSISILLAGIFAIIVGTFLFRPVFGSGLAMSLTGILFIFISIVLLCNQTRYLNLFLSVMIIFFSMHFISNIVSLNAWYAKNEKTDSTEISLVKLNKKPNIYLFWLESYHDFATQRNAYGIDTQPIQNFLDQNGFVTHDHVYTDSGGTLHSFAQVYGMGYFEPKNIANNDATNVVRDLIGGSENNLVFKNLKHNNYHTSLIMLSSPEYFLTFNKREPYLDQTDFDSLYQSNWLLVLPIYYFVDFIRNKVFQERLKQQHNNIQGTLAERVDQIMKRGLKSHQPFFIAFKGGAFHTTGSYTYKEVKEFVESKAYNVSVDKANKEIEAIVQNIIKNDPNSMIILVTDHGAWRYREADGNEWEKGADGQSALAIEQIKENLKNVSITYDDYLDDIFGGILAIRFPNGEHVDITAGHYMSQRNLFTHIFSYLSGDSSLLKQRKTSKSKLGDLIVIQDGKILHE